MSKVLIGSDPELMLRNVKSKALVSAIPVIKEGKGAGRPLDATKENTVLHDNVLVELNTKPAADETEFLNTISSVLRNVSEIIKADGLELHLQASADFPDKELEHPEARAFGCEPDFDAYALRVQVPPEGAEFQPFRSAGGHLHIGMGNNKEMTELLDEPLGKVKVVKALDIFCGIPSIFLDKDPTAAKRRGLYGKAGSHRPKSYGVEYRAISNWWLASPAHTMLVYRLSQHAMDCVITKDFDKLMKLLGGEKEVQRIINDSDTDAALKAYKDYIAPRLNAATCELLDSVNNIKRTNGAFKKAWKL